MFKHTLAIVGLTLSFSANAATLNVVDGQLMGAYDVNVDGALYDVAFVDGSCNSLFNGCSDFLFSTSAQAASASQALLDQVFINEFDTNPALTNGITSAVVGQIYTPYNAGVSTSYARNSSGGAADFVNSAGLSQFFNSTDSSTSVYAVWSSASEVPVPAAAWLFGSGVVGLGLFKRKRS